MSSTDRTDRERDQRSTLGDRVSATLRNPFTVLAVVRMLDQTDRLGQGRVSAVSRQDRIGSNRRATWDSEGPVRRSGSGPVGPAFSRSAPWHTYRRNPTPHHATPFHSTPFHSNPLNIDVDAGSTRFDSTRLDSTRFNSTRLESTVLATPLHSTSLGSIPYTVRPIHTLTTIHLRAARHLSSFFLFLFLPFLSLASFPRSVLISTAFLKLPERSRGPSFLPYIEMFHAKEIDHQGSPRL